MKLLSVDEFVQRKRHDSLAIMGSGYSINSITKRKWEILDNEFDTIGMGWYCQSKRPTTWYLVREQANRKFREFTDHTREDFLRLMAYYEGSCKVVKATPPEIGTFSYAENHHVFSGEGFVFREISGNCGTKAFRHDIFTLGIHHGRGTMYDVLHFAIQMDYKTILFCGVDLYDSRCFYLDYDDTLQIVRDEGRDCSSPHLTSENTVNIVKKTALTWAVKMFVYNPRSLLSKHIPVWEGL